MPPKTLNIEMAYAGLVSPYHRDPIHMSVAAYVLAGGPFGVHRSL